MAATPWCNARSSAGIPESLRGLSILDLDDSPQFRWELARRLEKAGCVVDLVGAEWLNLPRFFPGLAE